MYKVCIVNSLPIAMGVSNKATFKALTYVLSMNLLNSNV